jgi:hypothetical protein
MTQRPCGIEGARVGNARRITPEIQFARIRMASRGIDLILFANQTTMERNLMRRTLLISFAALFLTLSASGADARKPSRGGAVQTNYGCSTLAAGTTLRSSDGLVQKRLLMATSACYVCNTSTRVCTLQSPSTLVGWTFVY